MSVPSLGRVFGGMIIGAALAFGAVGAMGQTKSLPDGPVPAPDAKSEPAPAPSSEPKPPPESEPATIPAELLPETVPSTGPATQAVIIPPPEPSNDPRDKAIARATQYFRDQLDDDGKCKAEPAATDPKFGGRTALSVWAMLTAGVDHRDPAIRKSVDWLLKQKLTGTYAVATRACALAAMFKASKDAALDKPIRDDVLWLMNAADKTGAYTYTSSGGKASDRYDNSNSQFAILGIWAGATAVNMETPQAFWQLVERHWRDQQQPDGGWAYLVPPGALKAPSYGSMTAAGLATMYICFDYLHRDQFIRCAEVESSKPIEAALKWLGGHFDITENPRRGVNWHYYWLFSLERVAQASGQKYIAGHDWYAEGAAEILRQQESAGCWGAADPVADTAFAVIFIARGRRPMLLNKLDFGGKWNARPRDVANFAAWMSQTYEREVGWQAVRLDSAGADLFDAPILYISGAGVCEMSDAQIDKLRQFVLEGGMIITEAACNNADFSLDVFKLNKRLFPQYAPVRLPPTHPVYSINFKPDRERALTAVSNGVRLLSIHSPVELSLGLQLGPTKANLPAYETLANLCLLATDKTAPRRREADAWPKATAFEPAATINVARIKYAGNYDPEPLAWQRLAVLVANRHKIKLDTSAPMDIVDLNSAKWPIAAMTGTGAFKLTPRESLALRNYLSSGGTLVIDAAGGSREFDTSVESQVVPLVPDGAFAPLSSRHEIYTGPPAIHVAYRRDFALALGAAAKFGRLKGVQSGQRLAIIYSPDDLTAGLVGYPFYGIRGYTPDTAVALMTKILRYAAGVKAGQ